MHRVVLAVSVLFLQPSDERLLQNRNAMKSVVRRECMHLGYAGETIGLKDFANLERQG